MLAAEAEAEESILEAEAEAEAEEGDSMLAAEAEEEESIMEAVEAEAEEGDSRELEDWELILEEVEVYSMEEANAMCRFRDCVCRWERFTTTTRVVPGRDYVCISDADADAAADHLPVWSLLVGITDPASSSLQVSRLRVARSGRILGRSDDVLEVFHSMVPAKPPRERDCFESAVAPLPPDGRSLCVLHTVFNERPQAVQLALHPPAPPPADTITKELALHPPPPADTITKELALPEIEGTTRLYTPISAHGHIWALSADYLSNVRPGDDIKSFCVFTRRLVTQPAGVERRWEPVGAPFSSPLIQGSEFPNWGGDFLQGYAVLPDANLILVSFKQRGLFLTFAPDTGRWAPVLTDTPERRWEVYKPIVGRATYLQQHKAIYTLDGSTIFAYKLTYEKDDEGTQQLKLGLPVKIGSVCPFMRDRGYGLLTRLAGDLMCSVWISLAWPDQCPCDKLHAIVTTFHLHYPAPGGIKVLHSTYRRVDIVPERDVLALQKFCFLQEYEDQGSPVLQQSAQEQEDLTSSQHVDKPLKMLSCCRNMLCMRSVRANRFPCITDGGHFEHCCSLQREEPVKPATKKDLLIICQAGERSVIYQTDAMDGDVKPLEPRYVADAADPHWHFLQSGSKIQAVSSIRDGMLEFSLNKDWLTIKRPVRRFIPVPFIMVIRVGRETIAVTETLLVYRQAQINHGATTWLRYTADESDFVGRRVVISGYVAVNDDSFIVSDALTRYCLLFDLGAKQWHRVMPSVSLKEDLPRTIHTNILLNGRCVFVDGFIYTCTDGGIAAYELLGEGHSVYLSRPILLPVSQCVDCVSKDMCLDYAGKGVGSGANLFYVVQGVYSAPRRGFSISIVKVKTKRTASNKMKPVGIDQMDSVMRFIHQTEAINTRCCFAVSY